MSKNQPITTEHQLAIAARDFLQDGHGLEWHFVRSTIKNRNHGALVRLHVDGRDLFFSVEYKLSPSARAIASLAERKLPHPALLVTAKLTDNIARLCQERNINCLDLNGRVWIRRDGVLIDRTANTRSRLSFRPAQSPPDVFSTKSSRLVRILLAEKNRAWAQGDLVAASQLSAGLVSRLLRHLRDEGYVERTESAVQVTRHGELLDAWAARDQWPRRVILRQYSVLTTNLDQLAGDILRLAPDIQVAFTQWFAACERFPYAPPPVIFAYVSQFPDEAFLKSMQARPVSDGGRLWLAVPDDIGVFQQTRLIRGRPLVADPQIYLDLLQVGLRGPDQAKALREWEGFCQ